MRIAIVYPIWTYWCIFSSECLNKICYFPPSIALLLVMIFKVQKERLPFKRRNTVCVALCFSFGGKDVPNHLFLLLLLMLFLWEEAQLILLHWQILGRIIWYSEIFKVKYCFHFIFQYIFIKMFLNECSYHNKQLNNSFT